MIVTYDPEAHGYTIDGRGAPGIHEILDELNLTEGTAFMPEHKRTLGSYIHEAIDLHFKGRLDRSKSGNYLPWVDAAAQAIKERRIDVMGTEELVANPDLWYATKLDLVGTIEGFPVSVNFKSGLPLWFHALQAAAERLCLNDPNARALYIYLHPDDEDEKGRTYTFRWFHKEADVLDWKAACRLYGRKCRASESARPRGVSSEKVEKVTIPVKGSKLFDYKRRGSRGDE